MKHIDDFIVISNQGQDNGFAVLTLQGERALPNIAPGQFVEVRVDNVPKVFLRRPLSIHDVNRELNQVKLLVQAVGDGTRSLCALLPGDKLNLIYPLGKGFDMPESGRVLLVGGGCGIAPLLFLGRCLVEKGFRPRFLFGSRSSASLIALDEYRELGEVLITTEDGSLGTKGYVINHPVLRTFEPDFDWIFACGPEGMLKVLAKYSSERGINCQVSLENLMACGIGACLCCVVSTTNGNKCTCVEGPVFDSKLLLW